jgi:hypothetical protein
MTSFPQPRKRGIGVSYQGHGNHPDLGHYHPNETHRAKPTTRRSEFVLSRNLQLNLAELESSDPIYPA